MKDFVVELSKEDAEYLRFNIEEIDTMYNENIMLRSVNMKFNIWNINPDIFHMPKDISNKIEVNYFWIYKRFVSIVNLLFNNGYDDAAKFMFKELSKKYHIW